mgnify:FL=1
MITPEQLSQLVGSGECFIHTHPREVLGFQDRLDLAGATSVATITDPAYAPSPKDEVLLADTTAGNVVITLPRANKGREFQVIKVAGGGSVIVKPTVPDTINGSPEGVVFSNNYTSLRLKAVFGTGYLSL